MNVSSEESMSKAGQKLIDAAKEAVGVAKCEHDLKPQPHQGTMKKFYCPKCDATIWETPIGRS